MYFKYLGGGILPDVSVLACPQAASPEAFLGIPLPFLCDLTSSQNSGRVVPQDGPIEEILWQSLIVLDSNPPKFQWF